MKTMIGSATAAPGVSIAMSAAIHSALCIIMVSFFMVGMAMCHATHTGQVTGVREPFEHFVEAAHGQPPALWLVVVLSAIMLRDCQNGRGD